MHPSALDFGKRFFNTYCKDRGDIRVVDIGSQNVNGSLKDVCPAGAHYVGVDFVEGNGVDVILDDPYKLPFDDNSVDVVVCSSVFEHSQFFWLLFLEVIRVLKPDGLFYLNVPSNGYIHRYPVDCWRFYPDSGLALAKWAEYNGYQPLLLESFVGVRTDVTVESDDAIWNDFVAVYVKDANFKQHYPTGIVHSLDMYANAYHEGGGVSQRATFLSNDSWIINVKNEAIAKIKQQLASPGADAIDLTQRLLVKNALILELTQTVKSIEKEFASSESALADATQQLILKDEVILELTQTVKSIEKKFASSESALADATQQLTLKDEVILELTQTVKSIEKEFTNSESALADATQQILERNEKASILTELVKQREREIKEILNSTSWKVSKPIRVFKEAITKIISGPRYCLSFFSRLIWHKLPFSTQNKFLLKRNLFNKLPVIFYWSSAYKNWSRMNQSSTECDADSRFTELHTESEEYISVPLSHKSITSKPLVRLIAFYLPQFHAISENDMWWGEGFTEWSNVKPALPQFNGHYQPHKPSDLGYYNLLDIEVQRKQVELAKLYGVGGFCFYSYWFDGKLLLEKPVENYFADKSLDLPFCLCWANENWSRRWDGLDNEILISQNYSDEDDIAFIKHIATYFEDERYIRVNGKPLLLVYRPNLLPSAALTAGRWRSWCADNGYGEIYLAYTQSFESVDPSSYGFDAAVEFPPNNSAPPNITDSISHENPNFLGMVYDWGVFVERSKSYKKPSYKLFRGVCPSWDNTARRKNKGTVFLNSTPEGYQEWLFNALNETCERVVNTDERLVFVNAWNEWAEGAHLEPDTRYGYAHLEATKMALVRNELLQAPLTHDLGVMAVIIHAFYEDVLCEILEYFKLIKDVPFKLYITTTHEKAELIQSVLQMYQFEYQVFAFENRGRDILPFMKVIHNVIDNGHQFFVKLHTKKSLHREDGATWRKEILNKLIGQQAIKYTLNVFSNNKSVGIVGPEGHLVAMNYFWGSNANKVVSLSNRLGVSVDKLSKLSFVAGSMFFSRTDAIIHF